jgi:hypothetical protein
MGAPVLDLLPSVRDKDPPSLWVSPGDAHPNAAANIEYAKAIGRALAIDFPDLFEPPVSASSSGPIQ